jgi:hypothetical protein
MHGHGFGQCEKQMYILKLEFHEFNKFSKSPDNSYDLVVRMYAQTIYSLETFLLYFEFFEWNENKNNVERRSYTSWV